MKVFTFDDVLIKPKFSMINSRADVSLDSLFLGVRTTLPIVSSNMDTVTEQAMANAMAANGALGCLHRFCPTTIAVGMFKASHKNTMVSIGINQYERAEALVAAGAKILVIDVAHGAQMQVVQFYEKLRDMFGSNVGIVVGNFANSESVSSFNHHSKQPLEAIKVGVGGGGLCITREVTGCGSPTFESITDCSTLNIPIIADGGHRNSGDVAKSLAAGADLVMLGGMLAGTDETPGEITWDNPDLAYRLMCEDMHLLEIIKYTKGFKEYRGSASKESYAAQGKTQTYISPEGQQTWVPYKGPVVNTLNQIEGGLRSALTYVGAKNLNEFRKNVEFIYVTSNGTKENGAHGKRS